MKIAIVCDWLITYSGAERVIFEINNLFPDADIFTLIHKPKSPEITFLKNKITTSFLNKIPKIERIYRNLFFLFPMAIEQLDLSKYDLVISSSHAVAKGVITGPDQLHISYIHSPIRYAWDLQHEYLRDSGLNSGIKSFAIRFLLQYIRNFDVRSSNSVDFFISNSDFVNKRVSKCYRRTATTIYPPVSIEDFEEKSEKKEFYLAASRLVPYKKIDLVAQTFSQTPNRTLYIIGDGPDAHKIKKICSEHKNLFFLGHQEFSKLKEYLANAKAFIFAAKEDFGILPVEAMASGTPVIAYGKGGALETVVENETGLFFDTQSIPSLLAAVDKFENFFPKYNNVSEKCRKRAELFSKERFRSEFKLFVEEKITEMSRDRRLTKD
ncbi:hypothetical protein THS27_17575 [Thalassospira sp. MCCC 1A01428]|nr:hypothetical protein THS27_17575 [Thalassospira sp. MCCC 1A01428]